MKILETAVAHWGLFLCMLSFCSCSSLQAIMEEYKSLPGNQKEQLAPISETKNFSHIIKWPGENLTRISLWYTGTIENWTRIQELNSSIDPKRIDIGDTILIPENLLITREPMPMGFRGNGKKKKKPAPESLPEESSTSGENQLLNPIDIDGTEEINNKEKDGLSTPVDFRGNVQTMKKPAPESLPEESSSGGENQLFAPIDIDTQNEEIDNHEEDGLSTPMDFGGNVQKKKDPAPEALSEVSSTSGENQLFGPIDIDTQTEEINYNENDGLSMPLEAIE